MNGSGEAEDGGRQQQMFAAQQWLYTETVVGPNLDISKIKGRSLTDLSWLRMRQNQGHDVSTYLYRNNSNPEEGIQGLI